MKKEEYKIDAGTFAIGFTKKEIRILTWWACIGIARSKSGQYQKDAPKLIKYLADKFKIELPYRPEFNAKIKAYKRKK